MNSLNIESVHVWDRWQGKAMLGVVAVGVCKNVKKDVQRLKVYTCSAALLINKHCHHHHNRISIINFKLSC